jgi:hypothetical protein
MLPNKMQCYKGGVVQDLDSNQQYCLMHARLLAAGLNSDGTPNTQAQIQELKTEESTLENQEGENVNNPSTPSTAS